MRCTETAPRDLNTQCSSLYVVIQNILTSPVLISFLHKDSVYTVNDAWNFLHVSYNASPSNSATTNDQTNSQVCICMMIIMSDKLNTYTESGRERMLGFMTVFSSFLFMLFLLTVGRVKTSNSGLRRYAMV